MLKNIKMFQKKKKMNFDNLNKNLLGEILRYLTIRQNFMISSKLSKKFRSSVEDQKKILAIKKKFENKRFVYNSFLDLIENVPENVCFPLVYLGFPQSFERDIMIYFKNKHLKNSAIFSCNYLSKIIISKLKTESFKQILSQMDVNTIDFSGNSEFTLEFRDFIEFFFNMDYPYKQNIFSVDFGSCGLGRKHYNMLILKQLLEKNNTIKELKFGGNGFGLNFSSIEYLADLMLSMKQLERIDLSGNYLFESEFCRTLLNIILSNPNLKFLDLRRNPGLNHFIDKISAFQTKANIMY